MCVCESVCVWECMCMCMWCVCLWCVSVCVFVVRLGGWGCVSVMSSMCDFVNVFFENF